MTTEDPARHADAGLRALLAAFSVGDPDQLLELRDLLAGLGKRVFGMLLCVAALPAFIPIPGLAGAISGPLVMLVGVQLLIGLRNPWLPRFIAERGPHRGSLVRFERRIAPLLARIERVVRPRMTVVLDSRPGTMFTGLLLVVLGLLLALPIPFTNYLFGVLMLAYTNSFIDRQILSLLIFARAIFSWFDPRFSSQIGRLLYQITEPIIAPIRPAGGEYSSSTRTMVPFGPGVKCTDPAFGISAPGRDFQARSSLGISLMILARHRTRVFAGPRATQSETSPPASLTSSRWLMIRGRFSSRRQ